MTNTDARYLPNLGGYGTPETFAQLERQEKDRLAKDEADLAVTDDAIAFLTGELDEQKARRRFYSGRVEASRRLLGIKAPTAKPASNGKGEAT